MKDKNLGPQISVNIPNPDTLLTSITVPPTMKSKTNRLSVAKLCTTRTVEQKICAFSPIDSAARIALDPLALALHSRKNKF